MIYPNKDLQLNWEEMKVFFTAVTTVEKIINLFQDSIAEMNLLLTEEEEKTIFQHSFTLLAKKKDFIHSIVDNVFQLYYHILDQCIHSPYFIIQQENQSLVADLDKFLSRGYDQFEGYYRELSEVFANSSYAHGVLVKVFSKIDMEVKSRIHSISFSPVVSLMN